MIANWQKQGMKNMVVMIDTNVALDFSDFEDCLQEKCAKEISADYIVTRNIDDFKYSQIKAILPREFVEMVKSKID